MVQLSYNSLKDIVRKKWQKPIESWRNELELCHASNRPKSFENVLCVGL